MSEEKQQPKYEGWIRPLTLRSMASRIYHREDNRMDYDKIVKVLQMYFEEADKALKNGEKVKLENIGSLTPRVHTPLSSNILWFEDETLKKPYTDIKFTRATRNKQSMDALFLRNIKNGFAGLGVKCKCNQMQKNILIDKGFLEAESQEGDNECLEK